MLRYRTLIFKIKQFGGTQTFSKNTKYYHTNQFGICPVMYMNGL